MDFYHYYHYSVWNHLLVYLFSNPLLRNKGGSDQILSDTTTIHWNNECCIKQQQVWKLSFFSHKFNMLPEAATKHKVANQNEDFTHTHIDIHIYIYLYLLGYIQKLIQIPASFLCAICSASIFSFTVYKLLWPSQILVEAISCSYSVSYFQYKKWAEKLWHRHRTNWLKYC